MKLAIFLLMKSRSAPLLAHLVKEKLLSYLDPDLKLVLVPLTDQPPTETRGVLP